MLVPLALLPATAARPVWLALAVVLLAATLTVAVLAVRRQENLLAITLCGLAGSAVSPFAWNHHWVCLVPLAICIGRELRRGNRYWLAPALAMVLALPWIADLANQPAGGPPVVGGPLGIVLGNGFLLIYVLALACAAWHVQPPRQ